MTIWNQSKFSDSICPHIAFLSWKFSGEVSPMITTKASIFVEKKSPDAIPENESLMTCLSRDYVGSDKFCLQWRNFLQFSFWRNLWLLSNLLLQLHSDFHHTRSFNWYFLNQRAHKYLSFHSSLADSPESLLHCHFGPFSWKNFIKPCSGGKVASELWVLCLSQGSGREFCSSVAWDGISGWSDTSVMRLRGVLTLRTDRS